MHTGYQDLAADIERRIQSREWEREGKLPAVSALMEHYAVSKLTVRRALAHLEDVGVLVLHDRARAQIRTRTPIRIPLSRYGHVMEPGGTQGPWEAACAAQGLVGEVVPVEVVKEQAPADLAARLLGVPEGGEVVRRTRHALAGGEVVQVQDAYYEPMLAARVGLDSPDKIVGGVYGALTRAGLAPEEADETVRASRPSAREREELRLGAGVPTLRVERVTRSGDTVVEILRVSAPADRIELIYDRLPLGRTAP